MRLVTATPNALYCDTDEVLTAAMCALLKSRGIRGVFRYLSGLSVTERDTILASGLELYFVNFAHAVGWLPSSAGGVADGQRDLTALARLAIPHGVHVAFDLEGPGGTANDVVAHVTSHALTLERAQYIPSLYVGQGSKLTSRQLYLLPSLLYWHSCSNLRDAVADAGLAPACDYAIYQGTPFDVTVTDGVTSIVIDYDFVKEDIKMRLPIGVAA